MTRSDGQTGGATAPGTIITFYSYKGGTGRTMALANLAWILASNGYRVLAVDWDLESPGLHRYYHPFLLDKQLRSSRGVIDMVRDFADATLRPLHEREEPDWIASYTDVLRYAVSLDWQFEPVSDNGHTRQGYLDLLPAGRHDPGYSQAVRRFDWQAFHERLGGNAFLEELVASMRENYDYVLVDSRTGVSDSAGICTVRLPDVVVMSFTLNDQSIDGAAAVARSLVRQRVEHPARLLPVPMRVEDAEQGKLEAGRDHARRSFAPFLPRLAPEEADRYWGDIEIPYKPYYAYEEILAVFGDRPRQEGSLLAAYERLTRLVSDGRVSEVRPVDERRRHRMLLRFERPRASATADVLVSYSAVDRMWADWVSGELTDAGLRVTMREVDFRADLPTGADLTTGAHAATRVVVLLSQDYVQSPNAVELWKQAAERELPGGTPLLVPIRLDNVRVPSPFLDRVPVALAGITDEDRAAEVLLEALDQPHVPRPTESTARDRRRFPATEPPVWTVPQRHVSFTGRRALLEDIRNRLSATGTAVVPQALHGLRGVGKTRTVQEYAYRFRADYDVVWWVSAEQPSVARSGLAALGEQLGTATGGSLDDRVQATLDALRRGRPYHRWLLIFDNADNPDDLREFLPQGPGHVLLTTRNQAWSRDANMIEVPVFSRDESIELLRRRVPHLPEADAAVVADRLGDLPLAIEQAGAWLAATGEPVAAYLHRLEQQLPQILSEELPPDYRQTGAQPWLVSMESLRQRNPAAAKLLEVCAFFAPEPIPMSLLYGERFVEVLLPLDPSIRDPLLLGPAIREITRYALARIETGQPRSGPRHPAAERGDEGSQSSIVMHRLVQEIVRKSLPPEEAERNRFHVHAILAAANPKDPDQPENWPIYADLWPHLLPCKTPTSRQPEVRQLLLDVARYLWKQIDYTTCQELAEQTIEMWTAEFGEDDPQTLLMRFHLAIAMRLRARYQEAFDIDHDVYERLRRTLGEAHPYSLMAAGSLAADLRSLGSFPQARDLDMRTEELAREVFGQSHSRSLMAAHNLALSLRLVGDLNGALRLNESTMLRRREALGDSHPYTLYSASQYGRDLRDTGDLRESQRILEATVESHRHVLGIDHPETLRAMKNLAVTLRKLGQFEAARAVSTEALERSQRLHGPDHPDVQDCAMCLACDESALGLNEAAIARARPVYEWYRRFLGEDHLFTLAYANNLGVFLREAGEPGADGLVRDVVDRFTAAVGADHPYTLAARINLGNCLYDAEDYRAARTNDEQDYERIRRILGPDHPDSLAAANNLATSRSADGDQAGARELREQVMPLYRRVLGEGHPNTLALLSANRLNCDLEPPPT